MKRALICGVSGQDGSYLAASLLAKGYEVWGTSRDAQMANLSNHSRLGIDGSVRLTSMAQNDFRSVLSAIKQVQPNEIYFLSGQSSVGLSFGQPAETMESISGGVLNVLEAIRFLDTNMRLYHASSSESFGNIPLGAFADELTPFRPRSPYGVAKASAHWLVVNYRESYGMYCCSGVLFNHESPLRPRRFVTRKIVATACRIALGARERLSLGNISIARDWGWAPEYVEPMWRMLQQDKPTDFVIASGQTHSLEDFVAGVFGALGLIWTEHVDVDDTLFRPSEIARSAARPDLAQQKLGWQASTTFPQLIDKLVAAEMAEFGEGNQ